MSGELRSARFLAQEWQERVILPGDTVLDATLGNGHDCCRLAQLVGEQGLVYGFDVQQEAVSRCAERLAQAGLAQRCRLICDGHQHLADYVRQPLRCAVFNLGWLPGGDKRCTTGWATTQPAVAAALALLLPGGVCTVCAYPGHEAGAVERDGLREWLASLAPQEFNVLHQRFLNAGAGAPECFVIQRQ